MSENIFDFQDGIGPVAAHRHVNGGGWVADTAKVTGNAWVTGNARVSGNAKVTGNAVVSGNAWVTGNAVVSGNAKVTGNAWVSGNAWVFDNAVVFDNSVVTRNPVFISNIYHNITITDKHIQIGCQCFLTEELYQLTENELQKLSSHYKEWQETKEFVIGLARFHQKDIK